MLVQVRDSQQPPWNPSPSPVDVDSMSTTHILYIPYIFIYRKALSTTSCWRPLDTRSSQWAIDLRRLISPRYLFRQILNQQIREEMRKTLDRGSVSNRAAISSCLVTQTTNMRPSKRERKKNERARARVSISFTNLHMNRSDQKISTTQAAEGIRKVSIPFLSTSKSWKD